MSSGICQITPAEQRATGYGILNMAGTVASGAASLAAGMVKENLGIGGALQVAGGILLAASALLFQLKPGAPPETSDPATRLPTGTAARQ